MQLTRFIKNLEDIKERHGELTVSIEIEGSYFSSIDLDVEHTYDELGRVREPVLVVR